MKEGPMREQAALSNAPEGYLDFHDEYAELIAELRHLAVWPGHGRRPELHGARLRPLVRFRGSLRSASGARVRGTNS